MTVAAAPHPLSVFRYLKQAWREYCASGNAQTLTVAVVPTHAAAAVTTVTGTVLVDKSCPPPVQVGVTITQSATVKGNQVVSADLATGAWTTTFPANTCVAGTATATATTMFGPPVTTAAFTLT